MDVSGEMEKLFVGFYTDCFIHTLKQSADAAVLAVEVLAVAGAQRPHKIINGCSLCLFDHKVKVIWHEAIGKKRHPFKECFWASVFPSLICQGVVLIGKKK